MGDADVLEDVKVIRRLATGLPRTPPALSRRIAAVTLHDLRWPPHGALAGGLLRLRLLPLPHGHQPDEGT